MKSLRIYGMLLPFVAWSMSAQAGPAMSFYYTNVPVTEEYCIEYAYQTMEQQGMQPPGNIHGDQNFAMGTNANVTVIADCSQVQSVRRVTVIASSPSSDTADRAAKSILIGIRDMAARSGGR